LARTDAKSLTWEQIELARGPISDEDASQYVYFPCSSLIVLRQNQPASQMQVALVGRHGSSGVSFSRTLGASVVISGSGWRVPRMMLRDAARKWDAVEQVLAADNDKLVHQVVHHLYAAQAGFVSQRVAAWLAMAAKQSGFDAFEIVHEELATLLAIRRAGVTTALHLLEGQGAIRAFRGCIKLRDLDALEQCAGIAAARHKLATASPRADRTRQPSQSTGVLPPHQLQSARSHETGDQPDPLPGIGR
jgi:hypothetical protein